MAGKRVKPFLKCGFCGVETAKTYLPKGQKNVFCSKECLDNYKKTDEYRIPMIEAIRSTKLKNHGDPNYNNREKAKETISSIENFYKEVSKKCIETSLRKWGETNYFKTEEFKNRAMSTKEKKYGDPNYNNREKFVETVLKEYGEDYFKELSSRRYKKYQSKIEEIREERLRFLRSYLTDIEVIEDLNKNKTTFDNYKCKEKGHIFTRSYGDILKGFTHCPVCYPHHSNLEREVKEILDSLDIEYFMHYRPNWMMGKELDFFIPSIGFAIECNGSYFHSDLFKRRDYHQKKSELGLENNIFIFQLYDVDFYSKRDKFIQILKSKLKLNETISARKCEIRDISQLEYSEFLNSYHYQGETISSIRYGLFFQGTLVQVIGFRKDRENFILDRLCSKKDITVTGGSSKLLKHFEREYSPKEIKTYADLTYTNGAIYKTLGFTLSSKNAPAYFYVKNGVKYLRYSTTKAKLSKLLENFDPSKTEEKNMKDNGFYRVFDSGRLVFKKILS